MRSTGLAKLTEAIYSGFGARAHLIHRDHRDVETPEEMPEVMTEAHPWVERLVTVAKRAFDGSVDVTFTLLEHDKSHDDIRAATVRDLARISQQRAHGDVVQILGHPDSGVVAALYVFFSSGVSLSQYERRLFSGVGLHLENALRLRRRPDAVRAILSDDGRVVEGGFGPAPLWPLLASGQASLVASGRRSRRRYLLLEAPPEWRAHRRLSRQEARVVAMAARGHRDRTLSRGLALAPGTISRALRTAAAKIGVPSSFELIRIASRLAVDAPPMTLPETLTAAERDVLDLLRAGLSNREIAKQRGRATRTVANQVASLLRKTNSGSRRALAAAVGA